MALDKRIENIEAALTPKECPKCAALHSLSDAQLDGELKRLRAEETREMSVSEIDNEIERLTELKNEKIIKGM